MPNNSVRQSKSDTNSDFTGKLDTGLALVAELQDLSGRILAYFGQEYFAEHLHHELGEFEDFPDAFLDILARSLEPQPKNLDEVRKLPAALQPFAVEIVLGSLSNEITDDEGNLDIDAPGFCCVDSYSCALAEPGNIEAVLADLSVHTAEDLVAWIQARWSETAGGAA